MHVHILGICGTFMGSLALLARDLGHTITGSDTNIYPPMSTQLERAGVAIQEGYRAAHLKPAPDLVIVGNAMSRGNDAVEYMLNAGIPYTSGPQFLSEHVLQYRHVLAVAGTHGKTTTTTMLAWILHYCGVDAGFLIGGVPLVNNDIARNIDNEINGKGNINSEATDNKARLSQVFAHSSYLGAGHHINKRDSGANQMTKGYFVIEADEYDSAFFDKRSKFVHYRPRTAILNNLEFDHADIFADLNAIQTQFHHMIRMIPSDGQIIMPAGTPSLEDTIAKGCWTPIWRTQIVENKNNADDDINSNIDNNTDDHTNFSEWQARLMAADGSQFEVVFNEAGGKTNKAKVSWGMSGRHNVENAMVAIAAAADIGVSVAQACDALSNFAGIKRRMELIADIKLSINNTDSEVSHVLIYDDFAHHPTAINTTLDGARNKLNNRHIVAIIEPRSNTMKLGIHKETLAQSANLADEVIWYEPAGLEWGLSEVIQNAKNTSNHQHVMNDTQDIIDYVVSTTQHSASDVAIIIMSNGGFDNIHQRLIQALDKH